MKNNKPYVAELVSILGMGFVILIPTLIAGIYGALVTVGAISGIFNLFIHSSSNVSLIRISTRRFKVKKMGELIIGVVAMSLSFYLLLNTILQVQPYIVYSFLGWMVLGFFYLESLDIIRKSQNEQEEN
ncbi:hypothetical protein [Sulfuracidifex metallicus]|nr:hypothetical protein [Sulfuracidifex metallicus]